MEYLVNRFMCGQATSALTGNTFIDHTNSDRQYTGHTSVSDPFRPHIMRLDSTGEVISSDDNLGQPGINLQDTLHYSSESNISKDYSMKTETSVCNQFSIKNIIPRSFNAFTTAVPCYAKNSPSVSLGSQGYKYLPAHSSEHQITMSKLNPNAEPWYPWWVKESEPINVAENENQPKEGAHCEVTNVEADISNGNIHPLENINDGSNHTAMTVTDETPRPFLCDVNAELNCTDSPSLLCEEVEAVESTYLSSEVKQSVCNENPSVPQVFNIQISRPSEDQVPSSQSSISAEVLITPKMSYSSKKRGRLSAKRRHKLKEKRQISFTTQTLGSSPSSDVNGSVPQPIPDNSRSATLSASYIDPSSPAQTFCMNMVASPSSVESCKGSPFAFSFILHSDGSGSDTDSDSGWDDSEASDDNSSELCWDSLPSDLQDPLCGLFNFQITFSDLTTNNDIDTESSSSGNQDISEELSELESRLKAANDTWESSYCDIDSGVTRGKKVSFLTEPDLVEFIPTDPHQEVALAEARIGPWQEYARDHERFRIRIEELEKVISPCLLPSHRETIIEKLYS